MKLNRLLVTAAFYLMLSNLGAQTFDQGNTKNYIKSFKNNFWHKDDKWLAKDKLQHFSTSTFIFITNYYYQKKYFDYSHKSVIKNSYTISISLGLGKEFLDLTGNNPYFSIKDLLVDIAGNIAGHIIVNNVR